MIYEYQNAEGIRIERNFSPKGEIPGKIILDGIEYSRVYSVPHVIMDSKKDKYLDQVARKNTKRKIENGEIIPKDKKSTRPWWRKSDKINWSLTKMNNKQREKYIFTGKK